MKHPALSDINKDSAWLFGAQALAAARYSMNGDTLIDAFKALLDESNFQKRDNSTPPLPVLSVLWQLVADETSRSKCPADLALVIPDIPKFGKQNIDSNTGRTRIETLYRELEKSRPIELASSKIELVWRSVATARAVLDRGDVEAQPGSVFVINVNQQTSWTTLSLRNWSRENQTRGPLCIARDDEMEVCRADESLTAQRMNIVKSCFDRKEVDFNKIKKWTRWAEILASDMNRKTAEKFDMNIIALEHRSWPTSDGEWISRTDIPKIKFETAKLPNGLRDQLKKFLQGEKPLAVILECPAGEELIDDYWCSIVELAGETPVHWVTGTETVQAATQLAIQLGQDQANPPAWLDVVPEISLKVEERGWLPIIPEGEVIPTGKTYHSSTDKVPWIVLAPGIEQVHIHMRRGSGDNWDERYSGEHTGHTIRPSDHIKIIKPQVKVRPLSGDARLEIIEQPLVGGDQTLIGSKASIRWNEMSPEPPLALRSIPDLFIFRPSKNGWYDLEALLERVVGGDHGTRIKQELYDCMYKRWNDRDEQVFPLGSNGLPSRKIYGGNRAKFEQAQKLIDDATNVLLEDLDSYVKSDRKLDDYSANRMHMPLTWMFTACPEPVVDILLDAITNSSGNLANMLHMDNEFSAWAVYSGVGRAVRNKKSLRAIFDELICKWENEGNYKQDKFLLATVTHPMARRVVVRDVLNDDRERFERVKRFLNHQLSNLLQGIYDRRPHRNHRPSKRVSLELQYITMGYRGLCQVRYANSDWFPIDGDSAKEAYAGLNEALRLGNRRAQGLVNQTAPYLIGEGKDPTMPGGF